MNDPFERFRHIEPGTKIIVNRLEGPTSKGTMAALRAQYPDSLWWRVPQGGYSVSGLADILGCHLIDGVGVFAAIEMKQPKAYKFPARGMTKVQVVFGKRILAAGGIWGVACSTQQALEIIAAGMTEEYRNKASAELIRIERVIETRKQRESRAKSQNLKDQAKVAKRFTFRFKPRPYPLPIDRTTGRVFRPVEEA